MRDDTSASNGGLDKGVEFFVTADGKLQVARVDALDLEILGGVASKLENFSSQVLQDGSGVHGSGGTNTLLGGSASLQVSVDTTDGELESSARGTGLGLLLCGRGFAALAALSSFSAFTLAGHFEFGGV